MGLLLSYFGYLAIFGSLLPGKIVSGVTLADGTRLHYRCNGYFFFSSSFYSMTFGFFTVK